MKRTRKTTPAGWRAIATTTIEERLTGGVTKQPADYKPRQVVVTQLIDDRGRHWERYGDGAPVLVGGVPEAPKA